ncbi:hypothetical protein D3C72_2281280 [compost metagenome]
MALDRHGFEAFGHVGFVHTLEVHRHVGIFEQQLGQAAQIRARAVGQERQSTSGRARQHEQRLAMRIRLGIRGQQFFTQAHHFIARGVQLEGL